MKLNNFHMHVQLDSDKKPIEPHEVVLTINDVVEATFQEKVFPLMKIELLQGTRQVLDDGQIEYRFQLCNEKADAFRKAMLMAVFPANNN